MGEQLQQIAKGKEQKASPEQRQFHDAWQREAARAQQAEKQANQHARDRLKGLTAPELRKIGVKQLAWGVGLSFVNGIGGALGAIATGGVAYGIGTAIGWTSAVALGAAMGPAILGAVGGVVAGSEFVGYVYDKYIRKFDTTLPLLDKTDKLIGGALALTGPWTPPMIAGVRNIFDGYNNMKSIQ